MYVGTLFHAFVALAKIAHPVIKNYASDFYLHDAKVFADMKPGDVALWKPRESGSCLVIVARDRQCNERAEESFLAHASNFGYGDWYQIDSANDLSDAWQVTPCEDPERLIATYTKATLERNAMAIRAGETPYIVSESHF